MECWSAESTNTPALHHSVWDYAESTEMTNRPTGSPGASVALTGLVLSFGEPTSNSKNCFEFRA